MISKYEIFCRVVESGSFTKTAEAAAYTQSAVSQTVKALEGELGTVLLERGRDSLRLTHDGEKYYPYIRAIYAAEKALSEKKREMDGLQNTRINIGAFTGTSRNILPLAMKSFKDKYPTVTFDLLQGDYTQIEQWILDGTVDFGFVNSDAVSLSDMDFLYDEEMLAVLPPEHPLAKKKELHMSDLCGDPFILLSEGQYSVPMKKFESLGLKPDLAYEVTDDYTILAMVSRGIGVSLLYRSVVENYARGVEVRPVIEKPQRRICIAVKNKRTVSLAAQRFMDHIIQTL